MLATTRNQGILEVGRSATGSDSSKIRTRPGDGLTARVTLGALEFPRREAPEMQVVLVQPGNRPGARELDGDLHLIPGHWPTADGADG